MKSVYCKVAFVVVSGEHWMVGGIIAHYLFAANIIHGFRERLIAEAIDRRRTSQQHLNNIVQQPSNMELFVYADIK